MFTCGCEAVNLQLLSREDKAREFIPHICLIPKVIPLKLFLDMVPSPLADNITMRFASMIKICVT